MTEYGKIREDGTFEKMRGIRGVMNPSADRLAEYAAAHGYKPVNDSPQPNQYYLSSWQDDGQSITRVWMPMELEAAKEQARERVQTELSMMLSQRAAVDCPTLDASIVYDADALINALGLSIGDAFITADDSIIMLDDEAKIEAIRAALKGYRAQLYADATEKRAQINAAESVDDLAVLGY